MLVDITKIKMDGRIRKDFGNIEELAEDIKRNGLINPPVVIPEDDGTFTLLAGERRIRAMKHLGYQQIEVRTWAKLSDAGKLDVEISENVYRKNFIGHELMVAFERRHKYLKENPPTMAGELHPYDQAAKDLHTNSRTIKQTREILAHESELDPQMIADWDDRKLSTAALYRELKSKLASAQEQLATAEEERISAEREAMQARSDVRAQDTLIERMEQQIEGLQAQIDGGGLSEEEKRAYIEQIAQLKRNNKNWEKQYDELVFKMRDEREKMNKQIEIAKNRDFSDELKRDAIFFIERCSRFIRESGGYAYLTDRIMELPVTEQEAYIRSVNAVYGWARNILNYVGGSNNE